MKLRIEVEQFGNTRFKCNGLMVILILHVIQSEEHSAEMRWVVVTGCLPTGDNYLHVKISSKHSMAFVKMKFCSHRFVVARFLKSIFRFLVLKFFMLKRIWEYWGEMIILCHSLECQDGVIKNHAKHDVKLRSATEIIS